MVKERVYNYLNGLGMEYEVVDHPAAVTTELADLYVEGKEGVLTKTLFMAGKKDRKFYMIIMDEHSHMGLKEMSEMVGDRLHFAKEEQLMDKMGLKPGIVSLFGLLNNEEHDINVYVEKGIMNERLITFHPNDNTATVFMNVTDMFKVLDDLKYEYTLFDVPVEEE